MNKLYCVLALFAALLSACGTGKKSVTVQVPVVDTLHDLSFRKVMKDKEFFTSTTEVIPIDTIYVHGDTLHLFTKKITGCNTENFTLMWNGVWMKSLPAQAPVKLFELLPPDCKEQHIFHLTYNLKPIRLKQDNVSVDTTKEVVLLRISGWGKAVKYEY